MNVKPHYESPYWPITITFISDQSSNELWRPWGSIGLHANCAGGGILVKVFVCLNESHCHTHTVTPNLEMLSHLKMFLYRKCQIAYEVEIIIFIGPRQSWCTYNQGWMLVSKLKVSWNQINEILIFFILFSTDLNMLSCSTNVHLSWQNPLIRKLQMESENVKKLFYGN